MFESQALPIGSGDHPRSVDDRVVETLQRLHALPAQALFTTNEAALYLNAASDLLRSWRWQERGPAFVGRGHFVRYRKADLDRFLAGRDEAA